MKHIVDLIYVGDFKESGSLYLKAQAEFLEQYPDCKIEDASDFTHVDRFLVTLDVSEDDYFLWLIRKGWFEISFHWNTLKYEDAPRAVRLMKTVVEEMSAVQ